MGYFLQKEGDTHIDIFEKTDTIGGLAMPFDIQGRKLERYYHHIFKTDTSIISLINDLGLSDKLHWHRDFRATFYKGVLYPFNGALDMLRFTPLPLPDRVRLGFVSVMATRIKNWKRLEDVTADAWMRKYAGKAAYEVFWKPMLYGKFQEYYDKITMSWLWSRLVARLESKGKLGYMDGSFAVLFDALVEHIESKGGRIMLQTNIQDISYTDGKVRVSFTDRENKVQMSEYDDVIITTPPQIYTKFLNGLSNDYIKQVTDISYISAQTIVLTLQKQLSPYYWISVADINEPALVIVEQSNMVDVYNGKHIVYIGNYLQNDSKVLTMNQEELQDRYYPFLKKINKAFKPEWIEEFRVFRAPFAQPIVDTAYHTHIPEAVSPIEHVYILTMAQVYPQDRGMNFAIEKASELSDNIRAQWRQ